MFKLALLCCLFVALPVVAQESPPQLDSRFHIDALEALGSNQWKDLGRLNAIANQLLVKTREQEKELADKTKTISELKKKLADKAEVPK